MLEVPVYDIQGSQIEMLKVDEAIFGGEVNVQLLKQAVVTYHTNLHQGSAHTRNRANVAGSGRKLYKQKGTGNARRGDIRTNLMKGGGVAFGKKPYRVRQKLSKKSRQGALASAILSKLLGSDLMVVQGLSFQAPKTKPVAALLTKLKADRGCLLTLNQRDDVVYRSARNIPRVDVRVVNELNAFDVVRRRKMLVTREAMNTLMEGAK
jgi:large subunit ribosomal protein L4